MRLRGVLRYDAKVVGDSVRWLARSREHTNLTYDLDSLNEEHLAWFVANAVGVPVAEVRGYFNEVHEDDDLRRHIDAMVAASGRRRLADPGLRPGRRLGWYALLRSLRPAHVVETGTDKGLGSLIFASALLRNGTGRLTTMDINADSGYMIGGRYADVVTRRIGDSTALLRDLHEPVDMFLHDSLHTEEHELAEYTAVADQLSPQAVVLSDHPSWALPRWAEQTGRRFHFFRESPKDHWYPGGGIGLATSPVSCVAPL
jgi:predicted O-methyltransferase YrrM